MSEKITWVYPDGVNPKFLDFNDKEHVTGLLVNNMLVKLLSMFEWKGLPPTIDEKVLELQIMTQGYTAFIEHDGKHFVSYGYAGGYRDYNYRPTLVIVSNPYLLNGSKQYNIYYCEDDFVNPNMKVANTDGDAVVIQNDPMYLGVLPICNFYASQLAENLQTKRLVTILSRATNIFVANDDDDVSDFNDFMDSLIKGEVSAVLASDLTKKVNTLPFSEKGHEALTDLIEDQQYIKASWFNDLGLQANYNMKRESINSNESQLNKDAILPTPDTMLAARKLACKRIKEKFGLDFDVDFSSSWKASRQVMEESMEAIDSGSDMDETPEPNENKDEELPNQLGKEVEDET